MHISAGRSARKFLASELKLQMVIFQAFRHLSRSQHVAASSVQDKKRVLGAGAIAHINSGKTTTSEAMLYGSGSFNVRAMWIMVIRQWTFYRISGIMVSQ